MNFISFGTSPEIRRTASTERYPSTPLKEHAMGSVRVEYAGKSEESLTGPALVLGALLFFGAFATRR